MKFEKMIKANAVQYFQVPFLHFVYFILKFPNVEQKKKALLYRNYIWQIVPN